MIPSNVSQMEFFNKKNFYGCKKSYYTSNSAMTPSLISGSKAFTTPTFFLIFLLSSSDPVGRLRAAFLHLYFFDFVPPL